MPKQLLYWCSPGVPAAPTLESLSRALLAASVSASTSSERRSRLKLTQRITRDKFLREHEIDDYNEFTVSEMAYNARHDELFFVDDLDEARPLVVMHLQPDSSSTYRQIRHQRLHRAFDRSVFSVCHLRDSDTLLVCTGDKGGPALVALARTEDKQSHSWREAHRYWNNKTDMIRALSDSRVLIGERNSRSLDLFRIESGPRIVLLQRIQTDKYRTFSASSGSDTLVAMTSSDKILCVHRLCGDRLEKLARIEFRAHPFRPPLLLWLADRLLIAEYNVDTSSDVVTEFALSGSRLERRRELIAASDRIEAQSLCALDNGIAIFDEKMGELLLYSFD